MVLTVDGDRIAAITGFPTPPVRRVRAPADDRYLTPVDDVGALAGLDHAEAAGLALERAGSA